MDVSLHPSKKSNCNGKLRPEYALKCLFHKTSIRKSS